MNKTLNTASFVLLSIDLLFLIKLTKVSIVWPPQTFESQSMFGPMTSNYIKVYVYATDKQTSIYGLREY